MLKCLIAGFVFVALGFRASADDSNVSGALQVPHVFGDHMVLQTGEAVPVWGWGQPGETVTVGFAGQKKQATADSEGAWKVALGPLAVSAKPADLTISGTGSESLVFHDVLVGEVWLCSGQSNMELPLTKTDDAAGAAAQANDSQLRLCTVPSNLALAPRDGLSPTTPAADPRVRSIR